MESKEIIKLLLPLLLIPLTLYGVNAFGQNAGNIIIGISFFIAIVKFAEQKERRFMIVLAVFAAIFESVNVASGAYAYTGTKLVPIWIGLGWGIIGIYLVKNLKTLEKIDEKITYALTVILYLIVWGIGGFSATELMFVIFGIATVYVLSLSSKFPAAFFFYTCLIGMIIEFFGTTLGAWKYFDPSGGVIQAPLASLGLAYASVIGFCLWISKLE
ncbi:hypothetical protein HZC07_06285 [Candidatus Micrarchaeota archaeon]|nr:hypothetical protein [Candidatus Micrarchaeota archaeon]